MPSKALEEVTAHTPRVLRAGVGTGTRKRKDMHLRGVRRFPGRAGVSGNLADAGRWAEAQRFVRG